MAKTLDKILDSPRTGSGAAGRPRARAFLGRQPIYNVIREIHAYELLHRLAAEAGSAEVPEGDRESAEVVLHAFLDIGLKRVSPNRPVFLRHTEPLLALPPIVPPDRCVIEVLENVPVTGRTLGALDRLKKLGYRVALDDWVDSGERRPFLDLADYVKLDVRALPPPELERSVALLKPLRKRIVAGKIESEQEFRRCHGAGCDLFQGHYLRCPETVSGMRIPSNRLSVLSLLTECMLSQWKPIAAAIERDPMLTYGVLQMANSALFGPRRQIRSATEAVVRLGTDRIFHWAALLVMAGHDDCPAGYLEFAVQRAHMSQTVAAALHYPQSESYLAGLLSTLDSVFDAPLGQIVGPLPLPRAVIDAILKREGRLGEVLDAVVAYEACQFESATKSGIAIGLLQNAFWEAVDAARSLISQLEAARPHLQALRAR
jgi:EAL and modified HD-GYP domain-containing signal transduction protein